MLFDESTVVL